MDEEALRALAADIAEHGLLEPIELYEGKILNGRNRIRACSLARIEPRFIEVDLHGQTPIEYVLSKNLRRRQLTTIQLALLAFDLIPFYSDAALIRKQRGRGGMLPEEEPERGHTDERVGGIVGVSADTVRKMVAISKADPQVITLMRRGAFRSVREATRAAGLEVYHGSRIFDRHGDRWETLIPPLASYLRLWLDRPLNHLSPREAGRRAKELEALARGIERLRAKLEQIFRRASGDGGA